MSRLDLRRSWIDAGGGVTELQDRLAVAADQMVGEWRVAGRAPGRVLGAAATTQ